LLLWIVRWELCAVSLLSFAGICFFIGISNFFETRLCVFFSFLGFFLYSTPKLVQICFAACQLGFGILCCCFFAFEGGLWFVPEYCGFFQMMLTLVVVTRRAGRANNLLNMLMLAWFAIRETWRYLGSHVYQTGRLSYFCLEMHLYNHGSVSLIWPCAHCILCHEFVLGPICFLWMRASEEHIRAEAQWPKSVFQYSLPCPSCLGDGGRSEAEYNITFSESLKKTSREEKVQQWR
jgi:hypothetical protein